MNVAQVQQNLWVKRDSLIWLLTAHGFTLLPLFIYLPWWIAAFWSITVVWRVQIYRGAWPFPSNKVKFVLGVLAILGLFLSYSGAVGVEPLVGFLVISFVLKLLEVRSKNDYLLIIYVGFITVAAQFLFFQTMFIAIYGCISLLLLLCAWNTNYRSEAVRPGKQLLSISVLFLQSLPLMLVLFIVLPRIGTLWHVPIPQKTGVTGFSDSMSPGDFSQLSQSREVAFRVSFSDDEGVNRLPMKSQWYWRGLVLDQFDGRRWSQAPLLNHHRQSTGQIPRSWNLALASNGSNSFRYNVLMEPHQQKWLFTMMAPVDIRSSSMDVFFTDRYLAKSFTPVASRTQYEVVSNLSYSASPGVLNKGVQRRNLRLPKSFNPQALELARSWQVQGLDKKAMIDQALSYYRANFTYTLRPPALGTNSVDEFLFDTQRGFCEHFSSSFAVLMRAAGIPARVVLGYQGGEFNPIENYIIVRQSDAHAWTEVWLGDDGWVRVDPTAAVSPSRIELGLEESLGAEDQALMNGFFQGGVLSKLQLQLDAISFSWHRWVLSYDTEKQSSLLDRLLGGGEGWRIALFFVGFVSSLLLVYYLWFTLKAKPKHDYPEDVVFDQFLKALKKGGYVPLSGEPAMAFAKRVALKQPAWAPYLEKITGLYSSIAYSEKPELLPELERVVSQFGKIVKTNRLQE